MAKAKKSDERELKLLAELQEVYGYSIFKLTTRSERFSTFFSQRGKKAAYADAVAAKLAVPEDSALGKQMVAMYAPTKTQGPRPTRKRDRG